MIDLKDGIPVLTDISRLADRIRSGMVPASEVASIAGRSSDFAAWYRSKHPEPREALRGGFSLDIL